MFLIGLTGGIAAGKSVVGHRLAELGAVHVDADVLARQVVEPGTPALAQIAEQFGPDVIAPDGSLDRAALAAIIFADPEQRMRLNAIVHPAIWRLSQQLFAAAAAADPNAVVVYDVPLLVEGSTDDRQLGYDLIVVVDAGTPVRLQRLMSLRGLTREDAMHRLNSQASDAERLAIADVVIDSSGTLAHTLAQVDDLWHRITAAAGSPAQSAF